MPVIINDFTITVEAPKADKAQTAASAAPDAKPQTLSPSQVALIERHYRQRKLRIKAD